jgi:demethoxyubiquinone hydroxylase (CLK1/Coq7/Cat5 family)
MEVDSMNPVYKRKDGTYEIEYQGNRYHATETSMVTIKMVEEYLAKHPEELLTEPEKPKRTKKEKDEQEIVELIAYLNDTRYHIDIAFETGESVLPEIKTERAKARKRISELRG